MGIRNGIGLGIRIIQPLHPTKEIFLKCVRKIVIPTAEANRELPGCQAKPSIIVCDNCSCH
jgi:hypothetical protein